ncbi:uncharacterized protein LOC143689045 isoform X2 [Tamandua tetradactyla]|uniref:uncharacterized protein LOC143689045 isoform X2 n=1 Tax=Tamandua tetradactyla TaxID=48850 RepID=UPI0040537F65
MGCRTSKTSDFNSRELVLHSGRCWKYGDEYALESISKRSEAIATEKKTRDFGYRDGLSSPLPSGGVQGNSSMVHRWRGRLFPRVVAAVQGQW